MASLPVTLNVSFIGYATLSIDVRNTSDEVRAVLEPDAVLMEEAEVVGSRIDERQKQGPLTVESMDVLAIKEAPSGNFYEGLGNLKGVDPHQRIAGIQNHQHTRLQQHVSLCVPCSSSMGWTTRVRV